MGDADVERAARGLGGDVSPGLLAADLLDARAEIARLRGQLDTQAQFMVDDRYKHSLIHREIARLRAALDARGPVEDREYTEAALALAEATLMEFSRGESEETAKAFDDALLRFVKACPNLTAQVREINEARRASKSRPVSLARGGEGGTK